MYQMRICKCWLATTESCKFLTPSRVKVGKGSNIPVMAKRKTGSSENVPAKRAALGDLTNARWVQILISFHWQREVDYLEFTLKLQRWGDECKGGKECRIRKGKWFSSIQVAILEVNLNTCFSFLISQLLHFKHACFLLAPKDTHIIQSIHPSIL